MKSKHLLGVSALTAVALTTVIAFGQPPKAVLNASQLGVEDLDLDLDLGLDEIETTTAAESAQPVAEAAADADLDLAAILDDAEDTATEAAETVEETADALLEDLDVADAAEEAVEPVEAAVEEVAETLPEAEPVVEEAVAEVAEPVVEEAAEALPEAEPVVEEAVAEVVEPVVEEAAEAVEEVAEALPEAEPVAEAVAEVAEPAVEEVADALPEAEPVVEEVAEVVEAAPAPAVAPAALEVDEDLGETIDDILDASLFGEAPAETPAAVAAEAAEAPAAEPVAEVAVEPVAEVVAEPVAEVAEAALEDAPPAAESVAVAAPAEPEVIDPSAQEDSEMAKIESVRRQLLIKHGRDCLQQGKDNLAVGNWQRAIDKFNDVIRFLPEMDSTRDDILAAETGLGEAYYRIACDLRDKQSWEEAEKNCREARSYQHPKADDLLKEIRDLQTNPPPPPPKVVLPRKDQPEYKAQVKDIEERLKLARQYYATGEYDQCEMYTELILRDYPWCPEAIRMLKKLDRAIKRYNYEEREMTRDRMISDVIKTWVPQNYGNDYTETDALISSEGEGTRGTGSPELTAEMRIRDKMRRIVIPEIDFRQANITDVVVFLGDSSREYDDEDVAPEDRGVNFVLDLGDGGASSAPAAAVTDDPWNAPVEPVADANPSGVPALTIKSRYVSLQSTLDMIMDMSGLKYRIQGNVVMIMPKNKAEGELIHRMYNVLPSIGERINTIGGSDNQGSGDSGDPFAMSAGTTETTTDWKGFFQKLGVNWPDESSVTYMPSIGKLVVKNTATNLATLEQVLGALNVTPFQVEVEVRFVEVQQTDLTSLGLEWILNDDWEMLEHDGDSHLSPAARRRISMRSGSINSGFNYLSNNANIDINSGNPIADNIATFSSILTNPELSMVIHALANKSNADLLSAPKVVAMNGSQATVKTVVEYIYPTEYDVEMLESEDEDGNSSYSGAVVEPQNFFTREVGVILQVTPRVSADGTRIGLDLTPSVVSEPTWKNYGSTYPVWNTNPITGISEAEYVQLMMEQPFFPVRSLATSVEIYNGSTVVMGGMIREERYTEEDKIPFLGDIPILGNLFRYKSEQSTKRNLLIFVTARLVDPAGRKVKNDSSSLVSAVDDEI